MLLIMRIFEIWFNKFCYFCHNYFTYIFYAIYFFFYLKKFKWAYIVIETAKEIFMLQMFWNMKRDSRRCKRTMTVLLEIICYLNEVYNYTKYKIYYGFFKRNFSELNQVLFGILPLLKKFLKLLSQVILNSYTLEMFKEIMTSGSFDPG